MTDLAKLSNDTLMTSTKRAVKIETEATHEVILIPVLNQFKAF